MVSESVVLFFAVRADVTPDLDNLLLLKDYVMKKAEESAKEYFEEELSKYEYDAILGKSANAFLVLILYLCL